MNITPQDLLYSARWRPSLFKARLTCQIQDESYLPFSYLDFQMQMKLVKNINPLLGTTANWLIALENYSTHMKLKKSKTRLLCCWTLFFLLFLIKLTDNLIDLECLCRHCCGVQWVCSCCTCRLVAKADLYECIPCLPWCACRGYLYVKSERGREREIEREIYGEKKQLQNIELRH